MAKSGQRPASREGAGVSRISHRAGVGAIKALLFCAALLGGASAGMAAAHDAGTSSFYRDACLIEESEFVQSGGGFKIGQCYGFINGAVSALRSLQKSHACPPEGAGGVERYKNLWMAYLRAHPNKLELPAFITLRESLGQAFPCAK